jgi:hypothetical protein
MEALQEEDKNMSEEEIRARENKSLGIKDKDRKRIGKSQ